MVDVIDDQTEGRWLSACFYADLVSDEDEQGDLVPGGLSGADGYCFDLFACDEEAVSYVGQRIQEACQNSII